jgi:hypothetical protein
MNKILAFSMLLAVVAGDAVAHDGPGSPPYLYMAESEVEKTQIGSWTAAVEALIEAHDRHEQGLNWVVFREITGGPGVRLKIFRGFGKLAELDDWTPNRQILVEVFGPAEGHAVKQALGRGVTSSDRVISRIDELSRPWTSHDPPKFVWVSTVKVAEGRMTEYAALAKRVRRAFDEHGGEARWMCYGNAIGGDGSELIFFHGFDAFAEVDLWPSRREALAAAIGDQEAGRLISAMESMTETTTALWKLEPRLSRMGGE